MEFKVACATDDGEKFKKDHFGDAMYYHIYLVSKGKIELIEKINNPKYDHKHDGKDITGDAKKAKGIANVLNKKGVKVMFGYQIGPNIVRMKKKFVPVISRNLNIKKSLNDLQNNLENINDEYKKGKNRTHIILKNS